MAPPPPPHFPSSPGTQQVLQFLSTALSQRGPAPCLTLRRTSGSSASTSSPSSKPIILSIPKLHRSPTTMAAPSTSCRPTEPSPSSTPASSTTSPPPSGSSSATPSSPLPSSSIHNRHGHQAQSPPRRPLWFRPSPYLKNWIYPSSNLVDLVRSLSQIFSSDPPLYSRQNPRPSPNPTPSPSFSPSPSLSSSSSGIHSISPYTARPHARPTEDPSEVYRRNAMKKIVDAVHADSAALRKSQEAETEGLLGTQATLRQREEQIAQGLRDMAGEKEGLEQTLQVVLMNTDVLEGWVRENGGKWRGDVDAEDAFEPSDALSRQMLECTAADLAIETRFTLWTRRCRAGLFRLTCI
ncbi:Protein ELC-like [Platanthera zijinensis]|uniref:Protein ELC-like n=1 Tax=Platanthera zijinensis TaxID=2320716 RepID=A0AAP0G2S0_9ASPA